MAGAAGGEPATADGERDESWCLRGRGAFSGLQDIRNRTDGVVWAGPPKASVLHGEFVDQCDPGSPEWLLVADGGRQVVFVADASDLRRPAGSRRPTSPTCRTAPTRSFAGLPRLLFDRPDWLSEPAARDVSPDMFWMPFVTFWQVTADLPFALRAHRASGSRPRDFADAWAAVAPPPGWSARDTQRLRAQLATPGSRASA